AQQSLARNVSVVLDVLPDLTDRFEVLIVDDGSTDGTDEVAEDLARKYPQVNVVRHAEQRGLAESITTALERSEGEIVFVPDPDQNFEPEALSQLWQLRDDRDVAMARRAKPGCGLHMLRREDIGKLREIGIELAGKRPVMPSAEAVDAPIGEPSGGFLRSIGSFLAAE
ncbi:MAG: glycosyltransferase, partial [Planctomycetes bacterium]|nr:glycosyltransferase [Planctomycetota bacterium]